MPTWNRAHLLGASIRSVLGQTVSDLELVIVDDGSTDETARVVSQCGDSRVRYFRRASRGGIARARNECLSYARGRYVAWLDSDDLYACDALAVLSGALDRHPQVGLVHAAYDLIDDDGQSLKGWPLPFTDDTIEAGREALNELVLANYITTTTVMARREIYADAGGFALQMKSTCEDWELWLRLAASTHFAYVNTVVTHVRLHGGNGHRHDIRSGRRLSAEIRAVERFLTSGLSGIPGDRALERRARAAMATRILVRAGDLMVRGKFAVAAKTIGALTKHASGAVPPQAVDRLSTAATRGREFDYFRESRTTAGHLASKLSGSRFVERLAKKVVRDPAWQSAARHAARILRHVTPADARVAVIDKWDPTILHLSRRHGCHFPDLKLLQEGYPATSERAIEHLEALRRRGVSHLVLPSSAFWWLQHYAGFRDHLQTFYPRIWDDQQCVIFSLSRLAEAPA